MAPAVQLFCLIGREAGDYLAAETALAVVLFDDFTDEVGGPALFAHRADPITAGLWPSRREGSRWIPTHRIFFLRKSYKVSCSLTLSSAVKNSSSQTIQVLESLARALPARVGSLGEDRRARRQETLKTGGMRAMKKVLTMVMVAAVAALAFAPVAFATDVQGKVKSVEASGRMVTLEDGIQLMIPTNVKVDRQALQPGA